MHKMCISTTQVSSVMLRLKKVGNPNKMWKLNKLSDENQSAMKLSQIHRWVELCMKETIILLGWIYKIYFFLDSSIHIRILKQLPKYLATEL
jgi:hypothetical protein